MQLARTNQGNVRGGVDTSNTLSNYYEGAINQRCKLPAYLDGTTIYGDQIASLNKRMKVLDTFTATLDILTVVVIYIENYIFWENDNIST
jgi:hypothetical protein